ncbi:hypothetical protein AOQ84DRAFT_372504 [Glonium stellatum]|uniref:Uncharacterized protein n=1 Tax=Glonium stellatum TaxID=574774 RepID=A0A8E2JXQ7_9PEZI|nr:hypothetical protein AOQ84DRAFT_372504 [Glonium stellatum]
MERVYSLSLLDQHAYRGYVNLLFCFPETSYGSSTLAVEHFRSGSSRFGSAFPVVSGHVRPKPEQGHVKVTYCENDVEPPFIVQKSTLSYEELRKKTFSIQGPKFDGFSQETNDCDNAVMAIKITLIDGGLILCFSAHHSFVDAVGIGALIGIYAAYCAERDREQTELLNVDRLAVIKGSEMEDALRCHGRLWMPAEWDSSTLPVPKPALPHFQMLSMNVEISEDAIKQLKLECIQFAKAKGTASYVSGLDAATAVLFACTMRARAAYVPANSTCTLNVAVDCREKLLPPLPKNYLGNCHAGAMVYVSLAELLARLDRDTSTILADLAFQIRRAILKVDDKLMRGYITMIGVEPDIRRIWSGTPSPPGPSTSIMVSSWAKVPVNSVDFGCDIGRPEAVRVHLGHADQLCVQPQQIEVNETGFLEFVGPLLFSTLIEKGCLEKLKEDAIFKRWFKIVDECYV